MTAPLVRVDARTKTTTEPGRVVGPDREPAGTRSPLLDLQRTIGNRAVNRLVQRKAAAAPRRRDDDREQIAVEAARGVAGAGQRLPFFETLQRAFGRHDLGHVRAHLGERASAAAGAIGADAYATGRDIAFAGSPSLHLAAHEAAHVIQQRAGVQLAGGVGREDDAHERHADRVADAVVAGRSAEPLLDAVAPGPGAPSPAPVQMHRVTCKRSGWGNKDIHFEDENFHTYLPASHAHAVSGARLRICPLSGEVTLRGEVVATSKAKDKGFYSDYSAGFIQTVLSGEYRYYYVAEPAPADAAPTTPPPAGYKAVQRLLTPLRDVNHREPRAPWYSTWETFSATSERAYAELGDQPKSEAAGGMSFVEDGTTYRLRGVRGGAQFRAWLIVQSQGGWIGYLRHVDWDVDYHVDVDQSGATPTLTAPTVTGHITEAGDGKGDIDPKLDGPTANASNRQPVVQQYDPAQTMT